MKTKKIIIALLIAGMILLMSCAPLSAEETPKESAYYEKKYAEEPEPEGLVKETLAFLDTCVGGKYIFGGQGNRITHEYIQTANERYPEYLTAGRLAFFNDIADNCVQNGWHFPEDYAWDCSGLWWYCANELNLYGEYTDRTAHDTFNEFCSPITKEELRPGDLVFYENDTERITHMAIVGQKGYIYEAVSGFVGVVKKRTIDKRLYNDIVRGGVISCPVWNVFGRPKIFE